jgi:iron-sulfur cluster repair protein YtfE (RIC family)
MAVIEQTSSSSTYVVTTNLYRDVHKGIRAELFAVTAEAGRVDPDSHTARAGLAAHARDVVDLLEGHASHEDTVIQPALQAHLPDLAARIDADHNIISARTSRLVSLADAVAEATTESRAQQAHNLYLELAEFTGVYLAHQDVEERTVLPALEQAIGPDAVQHIHIAIVSSIPPHQMARSLAVMLPAMNIDNRVEMLAGMHAGAPPQIFEGIWGLANSVLAPADTEAVARRIGLR